MTPMLELTRDGIVSALRWHLPALADRTEHSYRCVGATGRLETSRPQAVHGRKIEKDDRDDRAGS